MCATNCPAFISTLDATFSCHVALLRKSPEGKKHLDYGLPRGGEELMQVFTGESSDSIAVRTYNDIPGKYRPVVYMREGHACYQMWASGTREESQHLGTEGYIEIVGCC